MENLQIKIKFHNPEIAFEPARLGAWIDLRAAQDVNLKAFESKKISLGISMKIPDGYEAHLLPRSSTFDKFGIILANSMGIIEQEYCGENDIWKFNAIALRDTEIHTGDRICQFRIVKKMPPVDFERVDHMQDQDRGGFGSTGTR